MHIYLWVRRPEHAYRLAQDASTAADVDDANADVAVAAVVVAAAIVADTTTALAALAADYVDGRWRSQLRSRLCFRLIQPIQSVHIYLWMRRPEHVIVLLKTHIRWPVLSGSWPGPPYV